MLPQVPELADGGFWYVVPPLDGPLPDDEAHVAPAWLRPSLGMTAWYGEAGGVPYIVIRTPEPLDASESVPADVAAVLSESGLSAFPRGRITGR
jgi:hypothetical protein